MNQQIPQELSDWLSQFLVMIDEGSVFPLIVLSGTMMWIGDKVALQRLQAIQRGNVTGVGAMLFYWVYGWFRFGDFSLGTLLFITWRGILLGSLTLGPAWILFSIFDYISGQWIGPIQGRAQGRHAAFRRSWRAMREEKLRLRQQQEADAQWEAGREDRERKQQEQEEKEQLEKNHHASLEQERRRLKVKLKLLYNKHREELKTRLDDFEFTNLLQLMEVEESISLLRKRYVVIKAGIEDIIASLPENLAAANSTNKLERIQKVAAEMDEIQAGLSCFDGETKETLESLLYEAKTQKFSDLFSE